MIHNCYSKKWSTTVTQKVIHKCYSKVDPQLLLKNWPTTVTQKVIHKRYSKIDPQLLLKNWPTTVTQKLAHNCNPQTISIFSNDPRTQKYSKTLTLSWQFFYWKIAATNYKKFKKTLSNRNYPPLISGVISLMKCYWMLHNA